jgi:hypothetical protein
VQALSLLNNSIEGDLSFILPCVKSTIVEFQVYTEDDKIVDPNTHPLFLKTLLGRQPLLEHLGIIYPIRIPANQGVCERACKSTQEWSDLDDLLSDKSGIPHLRSLDVDVIFPKCIAGDADWEEVPDEPPAPSSQGEQMEMAKHLKQRVRERLSKTMQRLHTRS